MTDKTSEKQCEDCKGTGERSDPPANADNFERMCPFCAGTGRALQLNASALAALTLGPRKR